MIKQKVKRPAAVVKQAYQLGFKEGLNEGNKRLNCLRTTNGYLWRELIKLDKYEPTEGIRLSVVFAEELVVALRRSKRNNFYCKVKPEARQIDRNIKAMQRFQISQIQAAIDCLSFYAYQTLNINVSRSHAAHRNSQGISMDYLNRLFRSGR